MTLLQSLLRDRGLYREISRNLSRRTQLFADLEFSNTAGGFMKSKFQADDSIFEMRILENRFWEAVLQFSFFFSPSSVC